jgi:hypothetical protein
MTHENLLGGPPPTYLPDNPEADAALRDGADPAAVAASFPACCAAWAAGWKGFGPIPWEHEPNRGFLRSLHMLAVAAAAIGEQDEAARCQEFLADSSPAAADALGPA